MSEPIGDLSNRMRDIFRLVVEAYLARGVPVGSKMLAASVSLSPASIRGVMGELEGLGLLASPHTSAGRMPTDRGLRLFVDGMMQAMEPSFEERQTIEARAGVGGPVEEALAAGEPVDEQVDEVGDELVDEQDEQSNDQAGDATITSDGADSDESGEG